MKKFIQISLIAAMMAMVTPSLAAPAAPAPAISPAERTKIENVVHEYLIKNPQVLIEVMQVLQSREAAQTQQMVKQTQKIAPSFANALFHQPNDPVVGNPNGKVTIVEFFDYQCPHCVDMVPVLSSIVKANPEVRVIYKEFPIRGALSDFAARAALAANLQGKYDVFSRALLISGKPLTESLVLETAKTTGLNLDKLKKDMDTNEIKNKVRMNIKLAQDLKLFGTPAFFIGKTSANGNQPINYMPGQTDQVQLQGIINQVNQ